MNYPRLRSAGLRGAKAVAVAQGKQSQWVMPAWMEPYRERIKNTGGNSIEELMNDDKSTMLNNHIRAALCIAIKSQVALLEHLHRDGDL
jgi:hypothetical protein